MSKTAAAKNNSIPAKPKKKKAPAATTKPQDIKPDETTPEADAPSVELPPAAPVKAKKPQVIPPKPRAKTLDKLGPHTLKMAQHERVLWHVTVPHGVAMEDLLEPYCWSHLAARLNVAKPFDRIELMWEDGTRYAELICVDAGKQYAKMQVVFDINFEKLDKVAEEIENLEYEVKHLGVLRWCVVRKSDNQRIEEGLYSRADANKFLNDLVRSLNS